MTTHKLFCFGHRGTRGHEPENTVRSVRRALELGADGVEVDVRLADGRLMVIHDATLKRTTNGHGRVAKKPFAYLRSLDAGAGERIPTLEEIFDAVDRRAIVNVELKDARATGPVAALIVDYVKERGWRFEDFIVSAFDHSQLRKIKKICPLIRTGALIHRVPRRLARLVEALNVESIHPPRRWVTLKLVDEAHRLGRKVFVFTVNEPAQIARMKSLGVDGVFTDFPERAR